MAAAGLFGGIINYFLDQDNSESDLRSNQTTLLKSLIIGVGASFLVPLFLAIISSDLVELDKLNQSKILVFFGFCLIAAISSKKFIVTISERVLKEAREAKQKVKQVEDKIENIEKQNILDAKALAILEKALVESSDPDERPISNTEIKESIKPASLNVKVTAFMKATEFRRNKHITNEIANRLIAIFEALIESDIENKYHRNHAQLSYILKDKPDKEYNRAEEELSKAIEIRDRVGDKGFLVYEFLRAMCKIENDTYFKQGMSSPKEISDSILNDLRKANQHSYWRKVISGEINKEKNESLFNWLKYNKSSV
jgi:hypothetical protein